MRRLSYIVILSFIHVFLVSFTCFSQKKELDEEAYRKWRRVDGYKLSPDGKWVMYRYMHFDNDAANEGARDTYYFYDVKTGRTSTLESADSPEFFAGGEWIVYGKKDGEDVKRVARCLRGNKEITLREDMELNSTSPMVAYQTNDTLVVKNIQVNDSLLLTGVGTYYLYDKDWKVIYLKREPDSHTIYFGARNREGKYESLYRDKTKRLDHFYFNEWGKDGGFYFDGDDGEKGYYTFMLRDKHVEKLLDGDMIETMDVDIRSVQQLGTTKRALFKKHKAVQAAKPKGKKDESFTLELWSWNDPMIPSQQAISGYRPAVQTPAQFISDASTGRCFRICEAGHPELYIAETDQPAFAYEKDETPYLDKRDWLHDSRFDLYLVNLVTAEHRLVAEALTRRVCWSPDGNYLVYYDNGKRSWVVLDARSFTRRVLTDEIPYPLHDELYDRPNPAPAYGIAGWSTDGKLMVVYDRFDIWVVDLSGKTPTYCWTKGEGRRRNTIFRLFNIDWDIMQIDMQKENRVMSMDWTSKNTGVWALSPSGKLTPKIEGAYLLTITQQSEDGKTLLCTKQNYQEDRDLWITDPSFRKMRKITDVNPQRADYRWGTMQQVEWTNYDGKKNQGLLYLPDGYDKNKSYPTIVTFYETHTPEMHLHPVPGFSHAMIDIPTYVSKGYIVFQPDVYFKIGDPGESSYSAVVSGTKALIEEGVIDPKRVGLQGHSWSGFQVAYLVTRTNMFTCVNIGAALINLTSVYTGIREESGIPCMLMYEDWQCRMGTTLWENLEGYIKNSPLLFADRIQTPALIFHCDRDGAVSYYDGRNLFLALRRLQRPAWMLNYMGEGHFLGSRPAQKDWTIRLEQFFNHYLKDEPMPRWMREGINIHERGYDQKYDF